VGTNLGDPAFDETTDVMPERPVFAADPLAFLAAEHLLNTIPDAVSVCDASGRVVYLNDSWAKLIGVADREAAMYIEPDVHGQIRPFRTAPGGHLGPPAGPDDLAINRALAGETVHQSEIVLVMPAQEGRPSRNIWLQTNAAPIRDRSGTVIGAIASSHDVTELRLLETEHAQQHLELQQKVQELEMIISSMADGVLITDGQGNTVLTNPAFDGMIGHEIARFPAPKRFHELHFRTWDGIDLSYGQSPVARALAGEKFTNEEFLITGSDGNDVYERVSGGPLRAADDRLVGGVFLVRDVTHVQEADRKKNEFVSLVAHELRTPITLIRGFSQLLGQSLQDSGDPETLRRLAIIDRRSEQLSRLITELLDVTRMEISDFKIQPAKLEYRGLVATVSQDMAALRPGRQVDVRGPEAVFVQGDSLRLQQVLINLIDNAFTHGPPATGVRIILRREEGNIVTRVFDEGPALPPAERERVFERFYQAGNGPTGSHSGIGLGLYISRRIVEAHGGQIWAEDSERSSFAFSLPMVEVAEAAARSGEAPS
jgi:PAS domain S-box-containing protein